MEKKELEGKLLAYSLGINLASLCFASAALFLAGPLAAITTFTVCVFLLLSAVYYLVAREKK